jgi:hypothetical protein
MFPHEVEGLHLQVGAEAFVMEEEDIMDVRHPVILENVQLVDLS